MKLNGPLLARLQERLARQCPPETLHIAGVEQFLGPSPVSIRPAIVGHLAAAGAFPLPKSTTLAMTSLLADEAPALIAFDDPATLSGIDALAGWTGRIAASLLQECIGLDCDGGAHSRSGSEDTLSIWIDWHDDATALASLRVALSAAAAVLAGSPDAVSGLRSALADLRRLCEPRRPSPETRLMIAAARAADIPVLPASVSPSMWQFGWGVRSKLFWVTSSNSDGLVASRIADLKDYQKKLFKQLGLPTPRWRVLAPESDVASALRHVGFPCVVKPVNQSSGRGVTANITNAKALSAAIALARPFSRQVILEAHEPGHDHRLLIINGRLEMANRLDPPVVQGDGRRTVSELVAELNEDRAANQEPGAATQVPVDEALLQALTSQQLTPESVPEARREILLRTNANLATGGTTVSVLRDVHPSIRRYAELLAEAVGLRTAGIDYVTPDIRKSHAEAGGGFLEINSVPGMARAVLAGRVPPELPRLVLGSRPGRIPVCVLIAPAERLEEIALKLVGQAGETTAIAASNWARIGSTILPDGNLRPIDRVTALLRYPSVTSLQILWTAEDICEWGLPVDSPACVAMLDASLDRQWARVVADRAGEVLKPRTSADAVRLLKQRAKAKGTAATAPTE